VTNCSRLLYFLLLAGAVSFLLVSDLSFALDPKFQLDINELRARPDSREKGRQEPKSGPSSQISPSKRIPAKSSAISNRVERQSSAAKRGSRKAGTSAYSRARIKGKRVSRSAAFDDNDQSAGAMKRKGRDLPTRSRFEEIEQTRSLWRRLVPEGIESPAPLQVSGNNFSLMLDPLKYPVLPAADGGRIIIDSGGALPPLVKAIIREKDPSIRIVTESPANRRSFYGSLLSAARFFSVQEDFSVDFGTDPKVTVISDFKVEKNSDSLLNNDVVLLNVSERRVGVPRPLLAFLEKEGFHVVEASSAPPVRPPADRRVLYSISSGGQQETVDSLLAALSVSFVRDRDIELDDGSASGIKLSVRADRYHEGNGGKIVFSFSEDNPVQYTLLKLLELKGYRVVMLQPKDDFRTISEKILSVFRFPLRYGMHHLWDPRESSFDVQLSGYSLSGGQAGGMTVLTNVGIDPLVRELLDFKGYLVIEK